MGEVGIRESESWLGDVNYGSETNRTRAARANGDFAHLLTLAKSLESPP